MEYIEGETLSEQVKTKGPIKPDAAMGIVRQLCAGLEQAHRQGVIHGDLKLANVLLTKEKRAVLTDFGLARFAEPDGSRILSRHGGTADYMAPELLIGEQASVASDVYAMGVLLHALLTGSTPKRMRTMKRPKGEVGTATLLDVEDPGQWEREIDALPKPWGAVVKRCLEAIPERRFASIGELMAALEPRRSGLKWVGAVAALALMAGVAYWEYMTVPTGPLARLAVLPVEAEAGLKKRLSPVAVDVAERLSGARRNFVVIAPGEATQNQVTGYEKAGSALGATHALETRMKEAGGQVMVEARVVDVASGRVLKNLSGSYGAGETATLAKAFLGTVNLGLNLRPSRVQETVVDAAYGAYTTGVATMRQDPRQVDAAVSLLEEAMRLDAKSALPYAAMAGAYVQKYRNGDGKEWLEKAEAMTAKAAGIHPDSLNVLVSAGLVEQQKGKYEQAIANFNRAALMDPSNAMVWRNVAEAYQAAGREEEAVATYRKAIEAEPNGYQSSYILGNYYLAQSEWKAAVVPLRTWWTARWE
ncbi:MAG: tetratricopeptide repeat protein [Acidobacteria bacterium]|nr:tetratricopeptide repeat protein [Acidobacteriota bacterium]